MKYYIPTTSLNIESILSTESISPISYYARRPFGSKFFQGISGVNMDNFLYLFSKLPIFTIPESEVEQYAIAIEIDDDVQLGKLDTMLVFEGEEFSILSCPKTIVLTPWNCRIVYFDERAYRQSRLMIEASRNSKIGLRYPWVYCDEGVLLNDMSAKCVEDLVIERPDDLAFNVDKGAIWGFVLGCSRTISDKVAQLVSISNRMRNIVSNAISNSGVCGDAFYAELKELDKAYRDIADKETNEQWNQSCSPEEKSILDKFQVWKEALLKFLRIRHLSMAPELPYSHDSKDAWVSYRDALNAYTEAFVSKERQNSSSILWGDVSLQDGHLMLNDCELINCVLEKIGQGKLNKEQIRINRETSMKLVLSEVSAILQRRLGQETWNQHPKERIYINQLYKNVSDFEPFNLNGVDNDELKAIAAFLLKGEDFDALSRYLEDNSVANYRLVFCLWGALEGYASIHKTLLSAVLSAENVCRVNILLGIQEMSRPFPADVHVPRPFSSAQTSERRRKETAKEGSCASEDGVVVSTSLGTKRQESVVPEAIEDAFAQFFIPLAEKCPAAERDRMIYHRLFTQYSGLTRDFYSAVVVEQSLNKGKGPQKNVLQYIEKKLKPSGSSKKNKAISPTVFDNHFPSTGVFLSDLEFLSNNSEFQRLASSAHKDWLKDLTWFIDAHRPDSSEEYYKGKPSDNRTVVIQFIYLREQRYLATKDFLFRVYHLNG